MNYVLDEGVKVDVGNAKKWGGCNLKRRHSLANEMFVQAQTTIKKQKE